MKDIYVEVRHQNFWWGIYNITSLTDWEDLILYEKKQNELKKIGQICICSRQYFLNGLNQLKDDLNEEEFLMEIEFFLQNNEVLYHYWYDDPQNKDFHEVTFEAERNKNGVKPSYIEVWYPEDGIDENIVETCALSFYHKFIENSDICIYWKEKTLFQDAIKSYWKFAEQMEIMNNKGPAIEFSEKVITTLSKRWEKPKEKVLEILSRNIEQLKLGKP